MNYLDLRNQCATDMTKNDAAIADAVTEADKCAVDNALSPDAILLVWALARTRR